MSHAHAPKDHAELLARLRAAPFTKGLTSSQIDAFAASVKFSHGHVAHMFFADIETALGPQRFDQLLELLAIPQDQFAQDRDATCAFSGQGQEDCVEAQGHFCDPQWCHKPQP